MPHQCTNCGHAFPDGSKEMLSGCPECGGNKFQFHPGDVPEEPNGEEPPERPDADGATGAIGRAAATVRDVVSGGEDPPEDHPRDEDGSRADDAPRVDDESPPDPESGGSAPDAGPDRKPESEPASDAGEVVEPDAEKADAGNDGTAAPDAGDEDAAQAAARSQVVDETDLPSGAEPGDATAAGGDAVGGGAAGDDAADDRPDMSELREELNDQFESIRIVEPGQYELNLMELYDREEYIIALQENGRYVIEVPDAWRDETVDG